MALNYRAVADRGPQPGSPAGVVVATGCKHSTNLITSLMNQLSLGSGRYRSRLCNWVAFESPTNPPIYSQLRSDRILDSTVEREAICYLSSSIRSLPLPALY